VLAATRLATELGAPLAAVLDGCARSLAADAEAEARVRAASAGPAQSRTLLTWLPLLGLVLGAALGADVAAVLLDGGAGTGAALLGTVLTVAGRRWVARLVVDARRARPAGDG
jgi:tight adherence protein B